MPVNKRLNEVAAELEALQAERDTLIAPPIELPEDLPALYLDLVGTLTHVAVAGLAADELHTLVETVVVSWDEEAELHTLKIQSKLLEMLTKAKPADEAGFRANESSLDLVAGARNRRCLPELKYWASAYHADCSSRQCLNAEGIAKGMGACR